MAPADRIAGEKFGLARIVVQGDSAGQDIEKLVLGRMPVALA